MKPTGYLSASETARRLGTTIKALRLYERHGLVEPVRSQSGWRCYAPEQIARLHKVLALKALGLTLTTIAKLLTTSAMSLADVLELQEQTLAKEGRHIAHALALVQKARAKVNAGEKLSIDDLVTLTKETTMDSRKTHMDVFRPLIAKYFPPEIAGDVERRYREGGQKMMSADWQRLLADARALMSRNETASPAAFDVARRWMALSSSFGQDDRMTAAATLVSFEAYKDPDFAATAPVSPDMVAFIKRVMTEFVRADLPEDAELLARMKRINALMKAAS